MAYITIVSNACMDTFPRNTKSQFTNLMPTPLWLGDDVYEIALLEAFIPDLYVNITKDDNYFDIRTFEEIPTVDGPAVVTAVNALQALLESVGGSLTFYEGRYRLDVPFGYLLEFQTPALGLPRVCYGVENKVTVGDALTAEQQELNTQAKLQRARSTFQRYTIPSDYYEKCENLVQAINEVSSPNFTLSINEKNGRVKCESKVLKGVIQFSPQIGNILGFRRDNVTSGWTMARYPFDLFPGFSALFCYLDIIADNQIIGNISGPLLRVLPLMRGKDRGSMISYQVKNAQYREVIKKELVSISLSLYDDIGRLISFANAGRVAAVLHLRKKKS
jgi:hypothetical protein